MTDNGSPPLSQTSSFTVNVEDTSPATISGASVSTRHGLSITLTFSQALDASTAEDPGNYILLAPAKHGRKSRKAPPPQRIALSVAYDPTSNTVTLSAARRPKLVPSLELRVVGTGPGGITKVTGLPLAGGFGLAGTDYLAIVTKKRVTQIAAVATGMVGLPSGASLMRQSRRSPTRSGHCAGRVTTG